MKKSVLMLLLIVATYKTTVAFVGNSPMLIINLLKSKSRVKAENGQYDEWKTPGKSNYSVAIYKESNNDGKNIIEFYYVKKKLLVKTYKYTKFHIETKDDIEYMIFEGIDNYNQPVKMIVSYPANTTLMSTAKWFKLNEVHEKYETEYEAEYFGK